ncbi:MAG: tRNA (adenosine(37)-N6)-threonylcarbamoyltransferase complex dimerization subunit type 1 TsaB [Bacilli bacterium]|jgi:universal bacterial protein yeaZ|nr:putative uncharacterized protein [Firmicutes bacterium CAG:345]
MNKLFLDTCTGELLVGLIHDGNVSTFEKLTGKRTSEKMLPTIQDLLNKEGLFLKDVDEVYVTKGPGSYTGSRLGLTFAKVLKVLNKNLKVFTCSTLQAMLAAASLEKSIALIDARNEAFFASINIKDENDCARLEFEEIKKYFERGYIPLIYKEDDLSFEELEKYNPLKVEPLKGMIEHQEIFTEIDDVNKINPYYLKGHGRE